MEKEKSKEIVSQNENLVWSGKVGEPIAYFKKLLNKPQWNSFYHQINEIVSVNPNSILEIGVGSGFLKVVLKDFMCLNYQSFDVDAELMPDFVGNVLEMPFADKQYDVIGCFQVLEHLPWQEFEKALSELFRTAAKAVIISLPYNGRVAKLQIPKICSSGRCIPLPSDGVIHEPNHFWEIGCNNYSLKTVMNMICGVGKRYSFKLEKKYRVYENPYHYFFVLRNKNII